MDGTIRIKVAFHDGLSRETMDSCLTNHGLEIVARNDDKRTREVEVPKGTQRGWLNTIRAAEGVVLSAELVVERSAGVGV